MPNHCCNALYFPEEFRREFFEKYIKKDECNNDYFNFEAIIPIGNPEMTPDWYNQRVEKWGTKWNGYDIVADPADDGIDFFTAWSPPVPIIKKLAELHPEYEFRLEYYETGCNFRGVTTAKWQDGEVLFEDRCWDITKKDLTELGLLDEEDPEESDENPFKGSEDERECHCSNCLANFKEGQIKCKGEKESCPACGKQGCIADGKTEIDGAWDFDSCDGCGIHSEVGCRGCLKKQAAG